MNNAVPPSERPHSGVTEEELKYSPVGYLSFWPAIIAGLLIAMGILGLNPHPDIQQLSWLAPLLLGAMILLALIVMPRARQPKEEAWERRAREAAEAAAAAREAAAASTPAEAVATVPAAEEKPAEVAKPAAAAEPVVAGDVDVLILWGSETGTAQGLAEMTESRLKDAGHTARAVSIGNVKLNQLAGFNKVLVLTSTWGDGEPPSNAIDMWEALQKEKVDLSKTAFSVLSLGDTAYPLFCKCGKDFDEFLAKQGAQRIHPRVDCDLDYDANFDKWLKGVQAAIAK
jgi:sulfite reductase alpha subunit-like flavoprotein